MSSTEAEKNTSLRKFGIVFCGILAAVALVSLWRGREGLVLPLLLCSAALLVASLAYPRVLRPLYSLMLRISGYMGWVNTRIILVVVYYLIFTPVALVFRLMGKDPLSRRFDREASSYWKKRVDDGRDMRSHFENQY